MERAAMEMELTLKKNITKFMVLKDSAYLNLKHKQSFVTDSYNFEVLTECIYLGTIINCKNDSDEGIKRRSVLENRCSYGMSKLMKSQLVKGKLQVNYKTIILPTVLYGSESWTLSEAHEALLGGFEKNGLRRIYGEVQIDGIWRRRYNKELYSLFNDVDVIKRIILNTLRWAGHVIRRENEEIIKTIKPVKPKGKRKNGRPRMR
jgi:hypothetical protein